MLFGFGFGVCILVGAGLGGFCYSFWVVGCLLGDLVACGFADCCCGVVWG